jgi:PAS domain S-box-containing protein
MIPKQSLLKRQLKRFFGNDCSRPAEWDGFIAAVDSAYADFEVDRKLMERSLELSSQELIEANSEIRAIFQAIPDLVFRLDREGTILSVKAGAGSELPQQELAGRRIQECWLKDASNAFSKLLRKVIDEKSMVSFEHSEGAPGLESFYEVRLVPLLGDQVVAIARNITKRKIAETKLEEMHKLLIGASRQAGMAEIANNVLHNVGNVLNSVNVSAGLIGDKVRDSKTQGLARVVQLMNDHAAALGAFLTSDERGKVLPGYLNKLVVALAAEKRSIAEELHSLTKNIDHIKDIVATQQSYSGATSVIESVQIEDLMEDALRMNVASMARHQVTVIREFADIPLLRLDKHLVLQILVNLISNAKYAMDSVPNAAHHITLRTEIAALANGPCLRILVKDDGEGISADNLLRLFAHGYTTRKNGHGFGLHSCALAAKEMAGTLTASSDGIGKGATFTLDLPVHPAAGLQ